MENLITKENQLTQNAIKQICDIEIIQLTQNVIKQICDIEIITKELKKAKEELTAILLEEMKVRGIVKIESEELTISYVDETTRESFEAKRFKDEHPDTYDEYVKISKVKPSLRIKVKTHE